MIRLDNYTAPPIEHVSYFVLEVNIRPAPQRVGTLLVLLLPPRPPTTVYFAHLYNQEAALRPL